ncbi:MAG: hypothetical protein ABIE74_01895 [Pseudomonadota bacterium]
MKKLLLTSLVLLISASCSSSSQFSGWQDVVFDATPVGQAAKQTFTVGEIDPSTERHILGIDFDKSSNSAGHFRLENVMVGNKLVNKRDIVIPPGSALSMTVTYSPLDLLTTKASYGGWTTGREERWEPVNPDELEQKQKKDELSAIHRSLVYTLYDVKGEGILTVQLIGKAIPGLNGEVSIPRAGGPCTPGGGTACYTGGFAVDLPELAPGGPKDMELVGPIRFAISGNDVEMRGDDFAPALMHLSSADNPQLPGGLVLTLIVSGAEGKVFKGTFDGARLTLKDVVFRVRVVLDTLKAEDLQTGVAASVDFEVPNLEIKTTEPLTQGNITLHMETTLPPSPSGNPIFDQFLSNAKIILIMKGELAM